MATDFSLLPPEVTSALMYSGPGASSFVAAASAWNALATELTSTAQGYEAVLDQSSRRRMAGAGLVDDGAGRAALRVLADHHRVLG